MRTPCPVTADLNRYLDSLDADSYFEDAVLELVTNDPDYSPFAPDNMAEAISEASSWEDRPEHKRWIEACEALASGDYTRAGCILTDISEVYWRARAAEKLEQDAKDAKADAAYARYEARRAA